MSPAVVESIMISVGSSSHIPPLPALIEDKRFNVWPDVSIKPPVSLLGLSSSCDALIELVASMLVNKAKGNVPLLASLPILIVPPCA